MNSCPLYAVMVVPSNEPVLQYAAGELRKFLECSTSLEIREDLPADQTPRWRFELQVDPALDPFSFAVSCRSQNSDGTGTVVLAGHDVTGVLHAVYTLLERVGVCFDILGPIVPDELNLAALSGWSIRVQPAVQRRGIRQHINFPMDISSYPLAEARDYIRNLARLRMNHITFHSYHGQWLACRLAREEVQAGHFFYGQHHPIPKDPIICSSVRNRRMFCIPEIEPVYDDPEKRSRAAMEWLGAVMDQARECGMQVQFSIEPPGDSLEDGLAACRAALAQYPQIGTLELITPETGGSSVELPVEQLRDLLATCFGQEVLADAEIISELKPGLIQFPGTLRQLSRNLELARHLLRKWAGQGPKLALGIYATCHPTLKVALAILRRFCPEGVSPAFLPSHGGRAAVKSLEAMALSADDWRRTMIYSWIEFDGNMYLQQNSVKATHDILALAQKTLKGRPLFGLALNHWRTAENRTAIRYAARAMVDGPLQPQEVYREYASALGLGNVEAFVAAMDQLDEADAAAVRGLFNVGFCFIGCWKGPKGIGWTRHMKPYVAQDVLRAYEEARATLVRCWSATCRSEGRSYLRFLDNRLQCTVAHIGAVQELIRMHGVCRDESPSDLKADQHAEVMQRCRLAQEQAGSYLQQHARMILDRGCEGTLISYFETIPVYIRHVADYFCGMKAGAKPVTDSGFDQPPPPALM